MREKRSKGKEMKIRKFSLFVLLFTSISIFGCSDKSSSMTKLDKEYDKYARNAAEKFLKSEVEDVTWTTVKVGKLEYICTFHNEENSTYRVVYIAKFDEEDEPEDQWVNIQIDLAESGKYVNNVSGSYMGADFYEYEKEAYSNKYVSINDEWYNINLTDEELKEIKDKRDEREKGEE